MNDVFSGKTLPLLKSAQKLRASLPPRLRASAGATPFDSPPHSPSVPSVATSFLKMRYLGEITIRLPCSLLRTGTPRTSPIIVSSRLSATGYARMRAAWGLWYS